MIDMYMDLPTEAELGQAIMEARKAESKAADPFDNSTFFEFWTPVTKHRDNVVSDKTGAVKPKCDFIKAETRMDKVWEDFLKESRAKDKKAKPVTKNDTFGSVVLDSFAQEPDPSKLVGSIKALKKTTIKEMSGKVHSKTEELGVNKVITKSMAASPSKSNLVGIVKPKKDSSWFKPLPGAPRVTGNTAPVQEAPVETKVYNSYNDTIKPSGDKHFAGYETKSALPQLKAHGTLAGGKTGAVKKKGVSAAGSKVFKNIDGFAK